MIAEWRVLCQDELRDDIELLLNEIGQALRTIQEAGDLASGSAGLAVFYAYMALAQPGKGWEEDAERYLDQAVSSLTEGVQRPHLYGGFTGIAWAIEHLQSRIPGLGEEDLNEDVDTALEGLLTTDSWHRSYDLISGLVGYGIYALERIHRPTGPRILAQVISHLDRMKEVREDGLTWHTASFLLPSWQRQDHPSGYYNLGVAHGVPGVIGLLGHASAQSVTPQCTEDLVEGAVRWLLAQQAPSGSLSAFETLAYPSAPSEAPSRIAWCYGDLGLSVSLLAAARSSRRQDWEIRAREIASGAASRDLSTAGAVDGGLCHGAAGNAHLFNRLWQATGDPIYREASLRWLNGTLSIRVPGVGIAGFQAWAGAKPGSLEPTWCTVPGFLEGAAGIGLSLISSIYPVTPHWDRVLMASIPES